MSAVATMIPPQAPPPVPPKPYTLARFVGSVALGIWLALGVGIFLTVTGLYLGVVAWRPWRDARLTPFRGWMAWHHLTGLAAGVLTLTWVASGLVSMNPWGFL